MKYDIDSLFNTNIPEAIGLPALGSTPGGNTFSDGVGSAINQGETQGNMTMVDGYFQSGNFATGVSGWKLSPNGDFEGNDVTIRGTIVIGGEYITVATTDSIQDALDAVNAAGGGTVVLENGTHIVTSDITMYSNTTLQGQNRSSSIIYFANTSSSIVAQGSNVYTTGTISVSNNGTTVTGSGTSWATNATAGQYIFLGGAWYPISVVTNDTSITIGLPYGGSALSGDTYIVCNPIYNAYVKDLTVSSSTDSGIKFYYVNNGGINNIEVQACAVGIDFNHTAQCQLLQMNAAANGTNYKFYDTHYTAFWSAGCIDATSGHGFEMNKVSDSKFDSLFILNSTGDGVNLVDCYDLLFNAVSSKENTGSGFELVSGNNMVVLSGTMAVNNGDSGIKLTATSDNVFIQNSLITGNTGYGVNVAASTDDSCVITGNNFSGNTTSAVNDSGTGTVIRGNVGVNDNSTSSLGSGVASDGSDGSYTLDGTQAAVSGLFSKSSNDYTLLRDSYFNNLTIDSGITLIPNGFRLFVKGTLTNNGTVTMAGGDGGNGGVGQTGAENTAIAGGTAGSAGAAKSTNNLYGGVAGKVGGVGAGSNKNDVPGTPGAGTAGNTGAANNIGSNGVASGAGGNGGTSVSQSAAPTNGAASVNGGTKGTNAVTEPRNNIYVTYGFDIYSGLSPTNSVYATGAGGGSAGGGGQGGRGVIGGTANYYMGGGGGGGGGSGANGGVMVIVATGIAGSGVITCAGGNGGNGGDGGTHNGNGGGVGGGGGGGAGGNGGALLILVSNYSFSGTATVAGGTGGTGGAAGTIIGNGDGAGTSGANGTNGVAGMFVLLN